ncbi:MAG: hypothetical protein ACFFEY_00910 [Candidatus Thorarchaeota archaeon]
MEIKRLNKNFLHELNRYDFSQIKEFKIYLVGSTKFKEYFIKIETVLQILYNKLVSICSVDGLLNKNDFSIREWEKLQEIALKKLHYQDAMLVIDINGYIGDQTREEIDYFKKEIKKPIFYLSNLKKL